MTITSLLRWTARLLSLVLATLFAATALGEGVPPLLPATLETLAMLLLLVALTALLFSWQFEVVGGSIALLASGGFYLLELYRSEWRHAPTGWVFPLLIVTPLLYLAASACTPSRGGDGTTQGRSPRTS